eukprot:1136257-Pelagomonas_calceolata.AAC.5
MSDAGVAEDAMIDCSTEQVVMGVLQKQPGPPFSGSMLSSSRDVHSVQAMSALPLMNVIGTSMDLVSLAIFARPGTIRHNPQAAGIGTTRHSPHRHNPQTADISWHKLQQFAQAQPGTTRTGTTRKQSVGLLSF